MAAINFQNYMSYMKNSLLIAGVACASLLMGSCNKSSSTPDTEEGNWVRRGSFSGPGRTGAVSFVINDTAYVGTGFNGNAPDDPNDTTAPIGHYMRDFWKFNIPAGTPDNSQTGYDWTQVAAMPQAAGVRTQAVGFAIGNKGYVGTGTSTGNDYLNDFWEFDGKVWAKKANLPASGRIDAVGFGLGSKGYICTGYSGFQHLQDNYQYNPSTNTWVGSPTVRPMGGDKRRGASVFVHGRYAYVFGGYISGQPTNDMWAFDSTNYTWSEKRNITNTSSDPYDDDYSDIARQNGSTFVIGDYGYYTAGETSGPVSKTWRYDFNGDQWERRTDLERNLRTHAVGFSVKNRGFVGLGNFGSLTFLEDFQEFMPDQTHNDQD